MRHFDMAGLGPGRGALSQQQCTRMSGGQPLCVIRQLITFVVQQLTLRYDMFHVSKPRPPMRDLRFKLVALLRPVRLFHALVQFAVVNASFHELSRYVRLQPVRYLR